MKNAFKFSIFLAMITVALMSCSKKNDPAGGGGKDGKLSPPSWIQGTWGVTGIAEITFTSNDVIYDDMSIVEVFSVNITGVIKNTIKETKNTSSLYEFVATSTEAGKKTETMNFSFKKGDGTYIEFGFSDDGSPITSYVKINKKK